MSLKDKRVKSEYRSLIDNVVQDFYIPLLHESISYKRAVGFFSSSSLVEISKGIANMAKNGGKIEIVASPIQIGTTILGCIMKRWGFWKIKMAIMSLFPDP